MPQIPPYSTPSEAYLEVLRDLLFHGSNYAPRGHTTRELTNYQFVVRHPTSDPIQTKSSTRNKIIARYLEKEVMLYHRYERRAEAWAKEAASFWGTLANPDGTINSNYGHLIFNDANEHGYTPWEWIKRSLSIDTDSRQAFALIQQPHFQFDECKDQPCTMHLWFCIRNGTLHLTTVMRSNDAVRGLVYDMSWFIHVQEMLSLELEVPMGTYTHHAHSMHYYVRDEPTVKGMLGC